MKMMKSALLALGLGLSFAPNLVASSSGVQAIQDRFESIEEVQQELRKQGLESSNLIVGIDFTKSNNWTGKDCFGGKCLHKIENGHSSNPYQTVINIIGRALHGFDDDDIIPTYGFGDLKTKDTRVFPMMWGDQWCEGFAQVEQVYRKFAESINKRGGIRLSGPTSFVPLIEQAIRTIEEEGGYHILVIIADGSVTDYEKNHAALVRASQYPLSVIMVGVGDGDGAAEGEPFKLMKDLDDDVRGKKFDNFQFVNFTDLWEATEGLSQQERDAEFALEALMEIPEQYQRIKALGLLNNYRGR